MSFFQAYSKEIYLPGAGEITCVSTNDNLCPTTNTAPAAGVVINETFTLVLSFLTIAAGLAFLIFFVVSALKWLTAGGDTQKVEAAQTGMTQGLIGLIIIVAAYGISWVVGQVLGIDILNPAESLKGLYS